MVNTGDYTVMFEALKNGALDAVVCDGVVGENYAEANGFVVMETPLIDEENSVIVRTGNDALLEEVNNAIAQFRASDAYEEFKAKWGLGGDGAEADAETDSSSEAPAEEPALEEAAA